MFAFFRPRGITNKYVFVESFKSSSLARHHINQSKIQIKKLIKSISGPSNVFYLCLGRVPSFSWDKLVPS